MKKIMLAIKIFVLAAIISLGNQNNFASAYNYDVGIYPESGLRGYLMTETLSYFSGGFSCRVVCYPSGRPYYINYTFRQNYSGFSFTNSDGYSDQVHSYYTPVEYNVWRYAWR